MSELTRMARKDADRAALHWGSLAERYAWPDSEATALTRLIALMRATDYPDDALDALRGLPASARDLQIREWTVRVALHAGDWPAVLEAIEALPADARDRDRWRYWQARALAATGSRDASRALFRSLAQEANYYGYLSAERIREPYVLCPLLRDVDVGAMAPVTRLPAFVRAIELFHVGQLVDARREFHRASRGLDPAQRRIAAVLAAAEGWDHQAILTLADAGFLRQYTLRFPLAWSSRVGREAARRRLNPSLVYGVMRSESAMAPDAVSSANARGLMQLTPATGRQVARRYRLPSPSAADLLDPEPNITLGTAYLDQLFERFGHPLKVLAAYNAGPEAVERWDGLDLPLEADRWIETVPYHETRDYLSRVLAFATIYDWRRLGRMVPLSVRMPPLDQQPGRPDLNARPSVRPACPLPAAAALAGGSGD